MCAEAVFLGAEQAHHRFSQWQLVPTGAKHQQAMAGAQLAGHHIHQADISPMGVEQDHFFQARTGHTSANVTPQFDQGGRGHAEGARKRRVLGAQTQVLGGQKQHRISAGQVGERRRHHAIHQGGVHIQGQMGTMLLCGTQGQNGHSPCGVEQCKVAGGELGPEMRLDVHPCILRTLPQSGPH